MRFYYYKNDNKKEIRKIDRDSIASDIDYKNKQWSVDIEEPMADYERVIREIYPSTNPHKDMVKMIPDVYEQRQSLKSNLFKATYQNYDGCFDVEGLDPSSHEMSSILKSALVYDCYRIDLQSTLDLILDDYVDKGECAWFAHWDKIYERRREQTIIPIMDEDGIQVDEQAVNIAKDVLVHEGTNIKRIDPFNLTFDKSQKRNWQTCGKIYRDFIPLNAVLTNVKYKLTRDEIAELRELVAKESKSTISDLAKNKTNLDCKVIGSTVEVLEYYGDYIIPTTGDVARNVIITIIAGKYVAQLDESLYPTCPIGYYAYNERPDTTRGQTPLKPALLLNELENSCMDLTMESWKLSVNPPFVGPAGAMNRAIKYEQGGYIDYDYDILDNAPAPRPVSDFSAGMRGFEFQPFFKQKMEGATGVTPYMQGSAGQGGVRTAQESTYIYSGQTTRLSREAFLFSHNVIVPIIINIFQLKKEYETEESIIPDTSDGTRRFKQVTDEVRKGNYIFMLGSAQTSVEREQYVQRIIQLLSSPVFQSVVQRPEFPASEFFKWILNEVNFRQIDSLTNAIGLRDLIRQHGESIGVPNKEMPEYINNMEGGIKEAIPEFSDMMNQARQQ